MHSFNSAEYTLTADINHSIILVHGLGSNPDKTWRAFGPHHKRQRSSKQDSTDSVCWPTDLLPDRLEKANRRRDRVWFYNYDSKWYKDAVHAQLADLAKCMLHCIHDKLHPISGVNIPSITEAKPVLIQQLAER